MENGKTVCMHFFNKRGIRPDPKLRLYNSPMKIVSETKFVDLMFGNKITFLQYIKMLKKCMYRQGCR